LELLITKTAFSPGIRGSLDKSHPPSQLTRPPFPVNHLVKGLATRD